MVKQTARGFRGALSLSKPSRLIKDRTPSFWESLLTALEHPDANITRRCSGSWKNTLGANWSQRKLPPSTASCLKSQVFSNEYLRGPEARRFQATSAHEQL